MESKDGLVILSSVEHICAVTLSWRQVQRKSCMVWEYWSDECRLPCELYEEIYSFNALGHI